MTQATSRRFPKWLIVTLLIVFAATFTSLVCNSVQHVVAGDVQSCKGPLVATPWNKWTALDSPPTKPPASGWLLRTGRTSAIYFVGTGGSLKLNTDSSSDSTDCWLPSRSSAGDVVASVRFDQKIWPVLLRLAIIWFAGALSPVVALCIVWTVIHAFRRGPDSRLWRLTHRIGSRWIRLHPAISILFVVIVVTPLIGYHTVKYESDPYQNCGQTEIEMGGINWTAVHQDAYGYTKGWLIRTGHSSAAFYATDGWHQELTSKTVFGTSCFIPSADESSSSRVVGPISGPPIAVAILGLMAVWLATCLVVSATTLFVGRRVARLIQRPERS